jgi:hypothetical protein
MKALWKSFIIFWVLTFAYQRKLFYRFWIDFFLLVTKLLAELFHAVKVQFYKTLAKLGPTSEVAAQNGILINEIAIMQERVSKMAVSLEALANEIDRVNATQVAAVEMITKLVQEVKTISDELSVKTAQAENTIDPAAYESLVQRLRASTDALASAVAPKTE